MEEQKHEITSSKFSLNVKDFLKGLLVSIGTAALVVIQTSIDAGSFNFDWKQVSIAAVGAGVAYLIKNFFTPAQKVTEAPNN
jgi:hypothetical protein